VGRDIVKWLLRVGKCRSETEALSVAQDLLDTAYLQHVSEKKKHTDAFAHSEKDFYVFTEKAHELMRRHEISMEHIHFRKTIPGIVASSISELPVYTDLPRVISHVELENGDGESLLPPVELCRQPPQADAHDQLSFTSSLDSDPRARILRLVIGLYRALEKPSSAETRSSPGRSGVSYSPSCSPSCSPSSSLSGLRSMCASSSVDASSVDEQQQSLDQQQFTSPWPPNSSLTPQEEAHKLEFWRLFGTDFGPKAIFEQWIESVFSSGKGLMVLKCLNQSPVAPWATDLVIRLGMPLGDKDRHIGILFRVVVHSPEIVFVYITKTQIETRSRATIGGRFWFTWTGIIELHGKVLPCTGARLRVEELGLCETADEDLAQRVTLALFPYLRRKLRMDLIAELGGGVSDGVVSVEETISDTIENRAPRLDLAQSCLYDMPKMLRIVQEPESVLRFLRELDLSENFFTELPCELFPLQELRILRLASNKIRHLSSEACMCFPKLTVLDLSNNMLEEIDEEISLLQSLQELYLSDNLITVVPPSSVGQLKNLTDLALSGNLIAKLPLDIDSLVYLERLLLARNRLTDIAPLIASLPRLSVLDLSYNELTRVPPALLTMSTLEYLNLMHNAKMVYPPAKVCAMGSSAVLQYRSSQQQ